MKPFAALLAVATVSLAASVAQAQIVRTTYYSPVAPQPTTVYYAPAPAVAAPSPVVVTRPAPLRSVTYYAPPVARPVASAVVYQPSVRVRTRYRPILGGTVTRVNNGYTRSVYPIVRY